MLSIPHPQNGDRLDADYLRRMFLEPAAEEFRQLRRLLLPPGLYRPAGSLRFNEQPVVLERILSRGPLTVCVNCPPTSGFTLEGDYLENPEPLRCEVVLPNRGEFTIFLKRAAVELPSRPVAPPVLLPQKFLIDTRGSGLAVAHGNIANEFTPVLDTDWIAPSVTVSSSRPIVEAVARFRSKLVDIDRGILLAGKAQPVLLARWSAAYAAWHLLHESIELNTYLIATCRFLDAMESDSKILFNIVAEHKAGEAKPSLAADLRSLEARLDQLATAWQRLLAVPLTSDIALESAVQTPDGTHSEIVLRVKEPPFAHPIVKLGARFEGLFSKDVEAVKVGSTGPHATIPARSQWTLTSDTTFSCLIVLTPEEQRTGVIRIFVRRELKALSHFTLQGA